MQPSGLAESSNNILICDFETLGMVKGWNVSVSEVKGRNGSGAIQADYQSDKNYGAVVIPIVSNLVSTGSRDSKLLLWLKSDQPLETFSVTLGHKNGGLYTFNGSGKWRLPVIPSDDEWQEIRLPLADFHWNRYAGRTAETEAELKLEDISDIRLEFSRGESMDSTAPKISFEDLSVDYVP